MKAVLFSLGTRGDIEPFLAIAKMLIENGHEVLCAFPEQFKNLAGEANLPFRGLSEKFLELIEGEKSKMVLGGNGNPFRKLSALIWMMRESKVMQKEVIIQQHDIIENEKPDKVIHNQKCLYPIVWGMANPNKSIMISPIPCTVHETTEHASLGMGSNHGIFLNKMTFRFSNYFLFRSIKSSTKHYHKELGKPRISIAQIKAFLLYREKMLYTVSPSLFPRPDYWSENVQVVGYHERGRGSDGQASEELSKFIESHKNIVFITFGSMTNPEPEQKTKDILNVLVKHKIPAIINTASGGLIEPKDFPEHVFFTSNIPYEWILPKMYAVIHHGGSGTTHIALKYGCASMIVPHILDQYLWNDLISRLGVGPKGISIRKFNGKRFETKILDILKNSEYKKTAELIAVQMSKENYKNKLLDLITN